MIIMVGPYLYKINQSVDVMMIKQQVWRKRQ
jgi:hypothetical protein